MVSSDSTACWNIIPTMYINYNCWTLEFQYFVCMCVHLYKFSSFSPTLFCSPQDWNDSDHKAWATLVSNSSLKWIYIAFSLKRPTHHAWSLFFTKFLIFIPHSYALYCLCLHECMWMCMPARAAHHFTYIVSSFTLNKVSMKIPAHKHIHTHTHNWMPASILWKKRWSNSW